MYQLFGATIDCSLPLPGLPRCTGPRAELLVRLGERKPGNGNYHWLHTWRDAAGAAILSCARLDNGRDSPGYLLRFPGLADFIYGDSLITCYPAASCREDTLRHLLLDQVIPRVRAQQGQMVLHASAVQLADGRVLAFAGETGRGKSTLAAALVLRGARLLDDDAIALVPGVCSDAGAAASGVRVVPGYGGLRLNPDSLDALDLGGPAWSTVAQYSAKRQRLPGEAAEAACGQLHRLYLLTAPQGAAASTIVPQRGAGLVPALLRQTFLLDVRDDAAARQQMALAAAVLEQTPQVFQLSCGRDYTALPALCDALMDGASLAGSQASRASGLPASH